MLLSTSCAKQKKIKFSGYEWEVKNSSEPVGPGNNYFSDSKESVWVDDKGLHLKLRYEDGKWYCSEVINKSSLGYGKYIFNIVSEGNSRIDTLDKNVVLGMFTYDNTDENNTREIDIEFSRFGKDDNSIGHYTVYAPGKEIILNSKKFNEIDDKPFELDGSYTTHIIDWKKDSITYESLHGHLIDNQNKKRIRSYTYTIKDSKEKIPVPDEGNAKIRINLWLFRGKAPTNKKEVEIIIKKFKFIPYE